MVYVVDDTDRARSAARGELASSLVEVRSEAGGQDDQVRGDRNNVHAPRRAGLVLRGVGGATPCTSAFAVSNPFYGRFLITAAHCYPINSMITQGGDQVGPVVNRVNAGNTDASVISTSTAGVAVEARLYLSPVDTYRQVAGGSIGRDSDAAGDRACMSGAVNNGDSQLLNCGIVQETYYRPDPDFTSTENPCYCFRRASYQRDGGDSGAPVYASVFGLTFGLGVHKGGNGTSSWYTHLPYALSNLNVQMFDCYS